MPLKYSYLGKELFPDYKGQYGEWHGKISFETTSDLERLNNDDRFKVSRNQLKGENQTRYITYRHYGHLDQFEGCVSNIRNSIRWKGFKLVKEEFEYCIYDSNKKIDAGWIDTPEVTDRNYLRTLALDNIVKRQSQLNNSLVLKGSLVTRQFIRRKEDRIAQDLDFVVNKYINEDPFNLFSAWVLELTDLDILGQVEFESFKKNEFWRRRDYAMSDDFPTTNTDLKATFNDGQTVNVGLDISWNLPIYDEITAINYECEDGSQVGINVVGLNLQISWKLHQCIVRPRGKDFLDIILLLQNNNLSEKDLQNIVRYYREECKNDNIDPLILNNYTKGIISKWMIETNYRDDYSSSESKFGIRFGNECTTKHMDRVYPNIDVPPIHELIGEFEQCLRKNKIII